MNFLFYQAHTAPYFKKDKLLKLADIVKFYTALFMHQFYRGSLPVAFDNFFVLNRMKHNYDTRLASKCSYALPLVRTNYGVFNINFSGPKIIMCVQNYIILFYSIERQRTLLSVIHHKGSR
jgi:hypothetical protein